MPAKLDRCVKKVKKSLKKRGVKGNPWAICKAGIKNTRRSAMKTFDVTYSFNGSKVGDRIKAPSKKDINKVLMKFTPKKMMKSIKKITITEVRKHPRRTKNGKTTVHKHIRKVLKCPGSKIRSKGKGRGIGIGKGKGPIGRRSKVHPVTGKHTSKEMKKLLFELTKRKRLLKHTKLVLPKDVQDAMYYLDVQELPGMKKESKKVLGIIEDRSPGSIAKARRRMQTEKLVMRTGTKPSVEEDSLLQAIERKDKKKVKELEEKAEKGEIIRLI